MTKLHVILITHLPRNKNDRFVLDGIPSSNESSKKLKNIKAVYQWLPGMYVMYLSSRFYLKPKR